MSGAHQHRALTAAPEHIDEDLVRDNVQLLLVLALQTRHSMEQPHEDLRQAWLEASKEL